MTTRLAAAAIVSLALTLGMTACAKSEYWVKGLTLPPGSTVVSQEEASNPELGTNPAKQHFAKELMIAFDCQGGWDKVYAHFDKCLKRAGYVDLDTITGVSTGESGEKRRLRMYSSLESKYIVNFWDTDSLPEMEGGYLLDTPAAGSFILEIIEGTE